MDTNDDRSSSAATESTPVRRQPQAKSQVKEAQLQEKDKTEQEGGLDGLAARANGRAKKRKQPVRGGQKAKKLDQQKDYESLTGSESKNEGTFVASKKRSANAKTPTPRKREPKGKQREEPPIPIELAEDCVQGDASLASAVAGANAVFQILPVAPPATDNHGQERAGGEAENDSGSDSDGDFECVGHSQRGMPSRQPSTAQVTVPSQPAESGSGSRRETTGGAASKTTQHDVPQKPSERSQARKKQKTNHQPEQATVPVRRMTMLQEEVASQTNKAAKALETLRKEVEARVQEQVRLGLNGKSAADLRFESLDLSNIQITFEIEEEGVAEPAALLPPPPPPPPSTLKKTTGVSRQVDHILPNEPAQAKMAFGAADVFDDCPSARNVFRPRETVDLFLMTNLAVETPKKQEIRWSCADGSTQTEAEAYPNAAVANYALQPASFSILGVSKKSTRQDLSEPPYGTWEKAHFYMDSLSDGQVRSGGSSSVEKQADGGGDRSSVAPTFERDSRVWNYRMAERSERRKGNYRGKTRYG